MAITHTYNQSFTPQDSLSYAEVLDLEPFFKYAKNGLDQNCCGAYYIPYLDTDTFQIQLQSTPSAVEFQDRNGSSIVGGITIDGSTVTFSFSGRSEDVLLVDIDGQCAEFAFKNHTLYTQANCCDDIHRDFNNTTVVLSSYYCDYDLLDNNYQDGYTNQVRVFAELSEVDQPKPDEIINDRDRLIRRKVKEAYEMVVSPLTQQSWLFKHLKSSVLVGDRLMVQRDDWTEAKEMYVTGSIGEIRDNTVILKLELETVGKDIKICC